jgi:hypothetical protein
MTRDGESIESIEGRLHEHERELARTLETIRDKLTSRELVGELYDRARSSGYTRALGRAVRDNPIPTVLAGVCAAWLAKSVGEAIAGEHKAQTREVEAQTREVEGPTLSQVALADTAAGGEPSEVRSTDVDVSRDAGEQAAGERIVDERVILPPGSRSGA